MFTLHDPLRKGHEKEVFVERLRNWLIKCVICGYYCIEIAGSWFQKDLIPQFQGNWESRIDHQGESTPTLWALLFFCSLKVLIIPKLCAVA